jgi:hypothetical protein
MEQVGVVQGAYFIMNGFVIDFCRVKLAYLLVHNLLQILYLLFLTFYHRLALEVNCVFQEGEHILFDTQGNFIGLFGLRGEDSLEYDEGVFEGIFSDKEFGYGVGEFVEIFAVEHFPVAQILQNSAELIDHFVLLVHMCNNLVVLNLDVGVKLLSLNHLVRKEQDSYFGE